MQLSLYRNSYCTTVNLNLSPVVTHTDFQPSAITHMRRLTVGGDGRDQEGDVKSPNNSTTNFNAVQFTSMKIEDDDSELDDSD